MPKKKQKAKGIHNSENSENDFLELKNMFEYMQHQKRSQESIIADIRLQLRPINERSLLLHIQTAIVAMPHREEVQILKGMASPLRQMIYLVDLYYSTENRTNAEDINEGIWERLIVLLNEVEMSYFFTISGYEEKGLEQRQEKAVSLATFIQAYSNPRYAYDEQVIERIERHFAPFESEIIREYGFGVNDIVRFLVHVENLYNQKLTSCALQLETYRRDSKKWYAITSFWEAKGIPFSKWAEQPEIRDVFMYMSEPGTVFLQPISKLYELDVPKENIDAILLFLTYNKEQIPRQNIYYTDQREYTLHPFILLEEEYLCPVMKFSVEAVYNWLNEFLLNSKYKARYVTYKSKEVEKKVIEILDNIFPETASRFAGYSIEPNTEQDILYIWDGYCFILEVKDYAQRDPRIDPYKSYIRINDDFKRSVQKGFDQCKRVEEALMRNEDVVIYNSPKCDKAVGLIRSQDVKDCFTIVVTRETFAYIQTDLGNLLQKDPEAHYPWVVAIDDLEIFVLLLKKLKQKNAVDAFSEYLDFRERYHGHLICFDELELAGYYLVNEEDFKYYSDEKDYFATDIHMSQIFDAYYACGLGFTNELNMDVKANLELPSFKQDFNVRRINPFM